MSGLTLTIPETDNLPWFNNFIAAILYSQYSRELIYKNDNILKKLKEIFKFTDETKTNLDVRIRIATNDNPLINVSDGNNLRYLNYKNEKEKIKELNINNLFYNYLVTHNKQLTAFILPKFLELIGSSCISVERYNSKNYIGLYDLVEYNKGNISRFFNNSAFILKDIKQKDIKKLYNEPKDFILINKWNKNIPDIFDKITKLDQPDDDDDIDNKYRLSSIYKKNKDDLDITDKLDEIIQYNDYYYKLDSCIISNNNEKDNSKLVTCLTHNDKRYVYLEAECSKLNALKSYDETFSIYSKFQCELFKTKNINIKPDEIDNISTYDMKNGSNYTLIYVKFKKIEDEKKKKEAINKIVKVIGNKILKDKTLKKAKKDIDSYRIDKIKELKVLEKEKEKLIKERDDEKAKYTKLEETFKKLKSQNDEDIDKNIKAIEETLRIINLDLPQPKKDDYTNLKKLLSDEYIKILKNDDIENIKRFPDFENYIDKIKEIQEEINNIKEKLREYKAKQDARKTTYEKNFIKSFNNIHIYLKDYIFFIIKLLSRQNTISLIQKEIKDLPDNKKINQILEAISKLPNVDQFQQLNDLLKPTEKKTKEILEAIKTLPNDAKLTTIENLLSPTGAKLDKILDTITELSKQDYKKIIDDLNAKMDAMQQILLSKIQEQRAVARSKDITLQPEIEDLKKQLQLMGDIQKQLADVSKQDYTKIIQDAIAKMPKEDNKKLIEDLNAKMDVMQQELIQKIQEQKAVARSRSKDNITIQPEIDDLKKQLQLMGDIQKQLSDTTRMDHTKIVQDLNLKLDTMQQELLGKIKEIREIKKSSSSSIKDNITLQSEITALNKQLELLGDIQKKLSETGERDNKQLLADMQKELLKYSHKDNELIIKGVQDLLRSFNENIILKQNEKDIKIHKEHLLLLKDIKLQLDKNVKNSNSSSKSKKDDKETELLKLENTELKKQIEILKDIQMKCERQQKDYERCNKHNMLPYKYIKFKEDELLDAIREQFKSKNSKPSDKIIIEFIFQYFEKNNKVMNLYIIEKYMGDIYDVMKIFNKKYNIERVNIKQFYRLLASISIYAKFNDEIKKIFIK